MSEKNEPLAGVEEQKPGAENSEPVEPVVEPPVEPVVEPVKKAAPAEGSVDDLPEWAQKHIRGLRAESGNYRTRLGEVEKKVGEMTEKLSAVEVEKLRLRLGRELPDELVGFLKGTTEDEVKAEVEVLTTHLASKPVIGQGTAVSGGLSSNEGPANDPAELYKQAKAQRY